MRLALLSSDQVLAASLLTGLAEAGHIVHVFDEKQSFLRDLGRESFDLVLVDGSPFGTGLQRFLRQVLMASTSGVTLICINCDDNETRLADAFALGVDDFIRRGVGCREICARIDAVLRRLYPRQRQGDRQLDYPPYCFDLETRTAWRVDAEVRLTEKEFALAVFLFQNEGRLFSRGHLMEMVWRGQPSVQSRTIDTHISRIRRHLMIQPENGYRLVAAYGTGYRLDRICETWVSPLLTVDLPGGGGDYSREIRAAL
ncbi:MAG: hypothetical protein RLZZ220_2276 [Pseudomonadota bacterium]